MRNMMDVKIYQYILEQLATSHYTEAHLIAMKYHFRSGIDSTRRYASITTLVDLLKILEKRDVINPENPRVLKYFATELQRNDLISRLHSSDQLQGQYSTNSQYQAVGSKRKVLPHINNDPVARVDDLISREIGHSWNVFCRKLGIGEGHIDDLEHRHKRIPDMVLEVLSYHREICDERSWKVRLCQALRSARRSDLSNKVEDIFACHGLM